MSAMTKTTIIIKPTMIIIVLCRNIYDRNWSNASVKLMAFAARSGVAPGHCKTTVKQLFYQLRYRKTPRGHQKTPWGHRKTSRGHRKTPRGHRKTSRGHRKTSRGHRKTSRGHRKTPWGRRKAPLGVPGSPLNLICCDICLRSVF